MSATTRESAGARAGLEATASPVGKRESVAPRYMMKAVDFRPGVANSIHLRDVPMPSLHDVPGGRGVLVKVLRVGVDGTDKEINAAEYGMAPPGDDYLILGHESFGIVDPTSL